MGEIAAVLVSFFWTFSSSFFAEGGKRVGSVIVNRVRLVFAVILLILAHVILLHQVFPVDASIDRWIWLGLSGVVGLALGDAFLFQAFVMVGARISMLVMACSPVISAIFAWIFLGETLAWYELAGIFLTVVGIGFVVLEQQDGNPSVTNKRQYFLGILCAIGGAIGQSMGMVLAKKGLYGDFNPLSGVLIRMLVAMVTIWTIAIIFRRAGTTVTKIKEKPTALIWILLGAIAGPFLGVWASLIAVQASYVGVASTLMSLPPIFMLPIARWVYKEKISWWAVFGTFVAISGICFLFLFG